MRKDEKVKRIVEMMEKYDALVWFARKHPEWLRDGHPSMPGMVEVKMKYKEEVEKLSGEVGDWTHGFNSGCLASLRLAVSLMTSRGGGEDDFEEFPALDT